MTSRDKILRKLRTASNPVDARRPLTEWRHMIPVNDTSAAALQSRFVEKVETLGGTVSCVSDPEQALAHVLKLITPHKIIQSWAFEHVPLPGLADALLQAGIQIVPGAENAYVGLTGADAALAGTGSLVLVMGPGKPRQPALLPPVHIAVITATQLVPNLDAWIASQRTSDFQHMRSASNSVVISGPSRTGDIANIPVKGVHGPRELHIVLLSQDCQN